MLYMWVFFRLKLLNGDLKKEIDCKKILYIKSVFNQTGGTLTTSIVGFTICFTDDYGNAHKRCQNEDSLNLKLNDDISHPKKICLKC